MNNKIEQIKREMSRVDKQLNVANRQVNRLKQKLDEAVEIQIWYRDQYDDLRAALRDTKEKAKEASDVQS